MANVKVPPLLHKMSLASQKAWYKKQGMEMPVSKAPMSAAKIKAAPKPVAKPEPVKKALSADERMAAIKKAAERNIRRGKESRLRAAFGGEQMGAQYDNPISIARAGGTIKGYRLGEANQTNKMKKNEYVRQLGLKSMKAGKVDPARGYVPTRVGREQLKKEETMNEISKAEAEKILGGPVKEKPKMPPGKQPAGYRYVRGLARKALKAGLKKEEVEQIDEISPGLARKAAAASQVKAIEFSDYSGLSNLHNKEGKKEANRLNRKSDKAMDYIEKRQGQKGVDKVNRMVTRVVGEEVELDETKKPDASMAMTHQLKMKMISDKDKKTLGKIADLMAAQKKKDKPVKEETEESTVQYIEEKLTAADPASKWISDFVHSDNPKFAEKSKEERIKQALGAYYAAKRGTNEEVEQIDELKKSTLASYVKKATRDVASASRLQRGYETDAARSEFAPVRRGSELAAKNMRKFAGKRSRGIAKAVDKLTKEEVGGKTPETDTEVELAKKHGNPKKITYGDVIKARIASAKKKALNKGE